MKMTMVANCIIISLIFLFVLKKNFSLLCRVGFSACGDLENFAAFDLESFATCGDLESFAAFDLESVAACGDLDLGLPAITLLRLLLDFTTILTLKQQ